MSAYSKMWTRGEKRETVIRPLGFLLVPLFGTYSPAPSPVFASNCMLVFGCLHPFPVGVRERGIENGLGNGAGCGGGMVGMI